MFTLNCIYRSKNACNVIIKTGTVLRTYLNIVTKLQVTQIPCYSTKINDKYPPARRDETIIDNYFGTKVSDPYRWLEDPDSNETKLFVERQNYEITNYLKDSPYKDLINKKLTKLWDYPKLSCPSKEGNYYFMEKNSGLQNQSILYKLKTLNAEPEVFLDPNKLSEDGTVSFSFKEFSHDGSTLAYGLSSSGSDWSTIHFKDVETGKDYAEVLKKVKFSPGIWTHDNKGIFYGMYPDYNSTQGVETESVENQKLFYHRLGTDQSEDVMVAEFPEEPQFRMAVSMSPCGRYLIIAPMKGCRDNLVYVSDLQEVNFKIEGKLPLKQLVYQLESDYRFITSHGTKLIFLTSKNAPNYRLLEIDMVNPKEDNWKSLIPEHPTDVLSWACGIDKDKLILCYMRDVKSVLQCHNIKNGNFIGDFPLDVGLIVGFTGCEKHSEIFYKFTSFLTPGVIWRCDLNKTPIVPELFEEVKVEGFNKGDYMTDQVFYNSKDGTKVPMFIVHKRDVKMNGENPTLLYGYGGFNISMQPFFSVPWLTFIQMLDGILAIPNIRGGGEYGERWHNSGRLANKQNSFDDFISAAEYLISNGYTKQSKLTIEGGSNGGLLIGACINQRPDLFGAAICEVGVLDMLRFHKFTIGYAWISDYGSSDDKQQFEILFKYSPLHTIKIPSGNVQYPATLLLTADHDDRVVPSHSLKYIATLQHVLRNKEKQKKPIMIRIETKAGHGGGKPTAKIIDEYTDAFTFIIKSLDLCIPQNK